MSDSKWTTEHVPGGVVCHRLVIGDCACIVTRGDDSEWCHWSVERDGDELERGYSRTRERAQGYALTAALERSHEDVERWDVA